MLFRGDITFGSLCICEKMYKQPAYEKIRN